MKQREDLARNSSGLDMSQDSAMSKLEQLGTSPGGQFTRKTSQEKVGLGIEKIAKMMLYLIGQKIALGNPIKHRVARHSLAIEDPGRTIGRSIRHRLLWHSRVDRTLGGVCAIVA